MRKVKHITVCKIFFPLSKKKKEWERKYIHVFTCICISYHERINMKQWLTPGGELEGFGTGVGGRIFTVYPYIKAHTFIHFGPSRVSWGSTLSK